MFQGRRCGAGALWLARWRAVSPFAPSFTVECGWMLAPYLAPRLVDKARVTLPELQGIYPAHFAPELAAALRKPGWRPVTGRKACHWTPPERPQSPQHALSERIRPGVTQAPPLKR
jgi:hypothetical protein